MCWTLDEAIKHLEEVAEEKEKDAKFYTFSRPDNYRKESSENCAAKYHQFAEWLQDYKQLLKRESCENAISRQAAIDAVIEWYGCEPSDINNFKKILAKQPSVTARAKMVESEG